MKLKPSFNDCHGSKRKAAGGGVSGGWQRKGSRIWVDQTVTEVVPTLLTAPIRSPTDTYPLWHSLNVDDREDAGIEYPLHSFAKKS